MNIEEAVKLNIEEAVKRACEEPTLVKALSWIAVWEADRAVRQALEWQRTGVSTASHGGGWDTCFEHCFGRVMESYKLERCCMDPNCGWVREKPASWPGGVR